MTPGILSSGLVPQPPSLTPFVPPIRNDCDTLLQPLFNEYFSPLPCVDHLVLEVATLEHDVLTDTPSSTTVDQHTPSLSTSQTPQESPSQVISLGVEEADHDIKVIHMDNNHYFVLLIQNQVLKNICLRLLSQIMCTYQPLEHISKWTKDHLIDNELVPHPDRAMIITLKWIYKVKLDKLRVDTPMVEKSKLDEDLKGKVVDPTCIVE
uniref:Integrase, catalytic region, zinc finger, CCHC-type, peptidase aspartic, catalytic n=1 Tax=Tanacetum cinerariifolium TaxID=118510 RepID=A0A699GMS2_TANCI|nr:hypothetical protein [Tanacetum cinerariifolium]